MTALAGCGMERRAARAGRIAWRRARRGPRGASSRLTNGTDRLLRGIDKGQRGADGLIDKSRRLTTGHGPGAAQA